MGIQLVGLLSSNRSMEDLQFTLGRGTVSTRPAAGHRCPCPLWTVAPASDAAFVKEALAAGVRAFFAFRLRIGAISFGTPDLHRRTPDVSAMTS